MLFKIKIVLCRSDVEKSRDDNDPRYPVRRLQSGWFHISLSHHLPRVCESKERCQASHIHQPEGKVPSYASNSFNRNLGTSPEPRHHNPVERGHMLKEPQLL